MKVFGDLFLAVTKESLEKTLSVSADAGAMHVYVGYAGWTQEQLENEVNLGAWYIFQGNAKQVFDADPESLWPRMIRQTEMHIASLAPWGGQCCPQPPFQAALGHQ
jgi:putative transcriptional regulator